MCVCVIVQFNRIGSIVSENHSKPVKKNRANSKYINRLIVIPPLNPIHRKYE